MRRWKLLLLATAALGAALLPLASATGASAATQHPSAVTHPAVGQMHAVYAAALSPKLCDIAACGSEFADFANYTTYLDGDPCVVGGDGSGLQNWGNYGCRNVDEYFEQPLPGFVVRLYYSPNAGGAWVCVPYGFVGSLAPYAFDDGPTTAGGYGQGIWNNVASSVVSAGTCGNPNSP